MTAPWHMRGRRPPRTIPAGTRVRLKVRTMGGFKGCGVLTEESLGGGLVTIMTDGGPVNCMSHELAVLRDQTPGPEPMRHRLPYGRWICADGREVLFNRDYQPIWQRRPGESTSAADRDEWVRFDHQEWFYDDTTAPYDDRRRKTARASLKRCEAILRDWGVAA